MLSAMAYTTGLGYRPTPDNTGISWLIKNIIPLKQE